MADNGGSYPGETYRHVGVSASRRLKSVIIFVGIFRSFLPSWNLACEYANPPIRLSGPGFRSKCDGEQAEGVRPLLRIKRICHHDLLSAPILSRRKRVDELQFVLSRDELFIPGRIRVLFDRRTLLGFGSNAWSSCKLLGQSNPGGHRETGANCNKVSSHKLLGSVH